jgi:hypothetical protein
MGATGQNLTVCSQLGPYTELTSNGGKKKHYYCAHHTQQSLLIKQKKALHNLKQRSGLGNDASAATPTAAASGYSRWLRLDTEEMQKNLTDPDGNAYEAVVSAERLFVKDLTTGKLNTNLSLQQCVIKNGFLIITGAIPVQEQVLDFLLEKAEGAWETIKNDKQPPVEQQKKKSKKEKKEVGTSSSIYKQYSISP